MRRFFLTLAFLLVAAPLRAEGELVVVTKEAAPQSASGAAYRESLGWSRTQSEAVYATEVSRDAEAGTPIEMQRRFDLGDGMQLDGIGVPLAIALILGFLLIFLKFGGSGALLSREPREIKQKQAAPESWSMTEDDSALDPKTLLERIVAMEDRRAALVRLLRHCLLAAGDESRTLFARADTEREAFRRLPETWRARAALGSLLTRAELAHYGGRPVTEEGFAESLETGRRILTPVGEGAA